MDQQCCGTRIMFVLSNVNLKISNTACIKDPIWRQHEIFERNWVRNRKLQDLKLHWIATTFLTNPRRLGWNCYRTASSGIWRTFLKLTGQFLVKILLACWKEWGDNWYHVHLWLKPKQLNSRGWWESQKMTNGGMFNVWAVACGQKIEDWE